MTTAGGVTRNGPTKSRPRPGSIQREKSARSKKSLQLDFYRLRVRNRAFDLSNRPLTRAMGVPNGTMKRSVPGTFVRSMTRPDGHSMRREPTTLARSASKLLELMPLPQPDATVVPSMTAGHEPRRHCGRSKPVLPVSRAAMRRCSRSRPSRVPSESSDVAITESKSCRTTPRRSHRSRSRRNPDWPRW